MFLAIITTFFFTNPALAQNACYSSQDCLHTEVCTVDLGVCDPPPNCGQGACPAVCTGTCKQQSGGIQLQNGLQLKDAYVSSDCTNLCPVTLWVELIEGVASELPAGAKVGISLLRYDYTTNEFVTSLSVAKPLLSTSNSIEAFAIQLPAKSISQVYPLQEVYQLKIDYNATSYHWYIKVLQAGASSPYLLNTTDQNPTAATIANFLKQAEQKVILQGGIRFPDLVPNSLADEAAYALSAQGVISGYPDGTFKPLNRVNRAEAAKFLLNARYKTLPVTPAKQLFPDVPTNAWFSPFIALAANTGVISGYPDGTFKPANTVNTAEFLKMLALTFNLPLNVSYGYIDVPEDAWFAQYAGIATTYNLFPKRPGYVLYPEMLLTREEVAIAINQLLRSL